MQNEAVIRGKTEINLTIDPPPDLVLESDFTNSSVNKDAIYSSIGVPELWRYKRDTLLVYHLVDGAYQLQDKSLAFPVLPVAEIPQFIEASKTQGQRGAVRLFRQRIRELL
uniref:Putative restriction endonuclease domain-containing protein n=1 Tax=Planktothricoides sp. SpSt-374 TaxID=2282167 RepID=A0A7C3ZN97_9CYAN